MPTRRDVLGMTAALVTSNLPFGDTQALAAESVDDPCYLSANELLARFRAGTLTPSDVLEAQISRIERFNASVNCITYTHFAEARAAADESGRRYAQGNPRPLEGLTVAVKDEYSVRGWVTTMGMLLLKDAPPEAQDNSMIERLRALGVVFHIQTTVPEAYCWATTTTPLWGTTRNPWNPEFSPGGSSGGSGAALAAGFTTLALGSDMAGSIRIPAALCGLYGFKAPFGRIPTSETAYETSGPMSRTFDDLVLLTNAMCGIDPHIHSSLRTQVEFPTSYPEIKGKKIAFDPCLGLGRLDPAVQKSMEAAVRKFQDLGAEVEQVDVGFSEYDVPVFMAGLFSSSLGTLLTQTHRHANELTPYVRFIMKQVDGKLGPDAVDAADRLTKKYHADVQEKVFQRGYSAMIMPTLGTSLVPAEHGMNPIEDAVIVGGHPAYGLNFVYTWPWNLLSRYPVVSVPTGIGSESMPAGMQIIGNTFDDLTTFQFAAAYSRSTTQLYSGNIFPVMKAG
ncbi:amidase [Burkholderia stabilis]|nr:amidase [Burkholderia stabilis]